MDRHCGQEEPDGSEEAVDAVTGSTDWITDYHLDEAIGSSGLPADIAPLGQPLSIARREKG